LGIERQGVRACPHNGGDDNSNDVMCSVTCVVLAFYRGRRGEGAQKHEQPFCGMAVI